jgi:hypothetical protein
MPLWSWQLKSWRERDDQQHRVLSSPRLFRTPREASCYYYFFPPAQRVPQLLAGACHCSPHAKKPKKHLKFQIERFPCFDDKEWRRLWVIGVAGISQPVTGRIISIDFVATRARPAHLSDQRERRIRFMILNKMTRCSWGRAHVFICHAWFFSRLNNNDGKDFQNMWSLDFMMRRKCSMLMIEEYPKIEWKKECKKD